MLGWPGSRGGEEGACVGSGICGNQMCWQLTRSGRVGWGIWGWDWFHFGRQDRRSPSPPKSYGAFPVSLHPPSSALLSESCILYPCIESLARLEGEKSPRLLSPHPTALSSWSFTSLLLVSLPPSAPFFPFCLLLPRFLFLLWLTPSPTPTCRRLARWAGASCSCK